MVEIVFSGRGGQGAVTAAQVLATAAFQEGKYAQAFPSFGPERRGAPVTAYARIEEHRIVDRSQILKADYVLVLDPNVLETAMPLNAVKEGGCAILNVDWSERKIRAEGEVKAIQIFGIDASAISEEVYGKRPIPITNIAMLGAFAAVSGAVQLDTILLAVDEFFLGEQAEDAKRTARMAFGKLEGAKTS
jgi:2-oxoisovalerate ferredoxin oxidoreductase gamma subunit